MDDPIYKINFHFVWFTIPTALSLNLAQNAFQIHLEIFVQPYKCIELEITQNFNVAYIELTPGSQRAKKTVGIVLNIIGNFSLKILWKWLLSRDASTWVLNESEFFYLNYKNCNCKRLFFEN